MTEFELPPGPALDYERANFAPSDSMSEADCDRMERAAMHVEAANALCLRASEEIDYLKRIILALLNRNITYHDTVAHLPFESHDQAINHIAEARRAATAVPIE